MPKNAQLRHGDFLITWGKHKGKTLQQLRGRSFGFIVWLTGQLRGTYGEYIDCELWAVDKLGCKFDYRSKTKICYHCEFPDLHSPKECLFELAGETKEEGQMNLDSRLDEKFVQDHFGLYTHWKKVQKEHPEAIDAAKLFIALNRLCLNCGKQILEPDKETKRRIYCNKCK